jgi:RNase P subunit RPR2
MPQHVICDACKAVLYEGRELKSPEEVIQENGGTCPQCGKKLSFFPEKVDIDTHPQ